MGSHWKNNLAASSGESHSQVKDILFSDKKGRDLTLYSRMSALDEY
jgi:hypothetical protein